MDKKIAFNDVPAQWEEIRTSAIKKVDELGKRGDYIGGKAIQEFESSFSSFVGAKYSVGISNGTDALKIGFQLFNLNSEDVVIVPANTFIADYLAIKNCPIDHPTVVLVDHSEDYTIDTDHLAEFLLKSRKKYRKAVVVPVHLYGHPCDMDSLTKLKNEHDLLIMEDCSQAHGTRYKGQHVGYLGEVSVYSLYPGKNLGAIGDAGILTTDSIEFYNRARSLRNYGSSKKYHYDELGNNHRMDTIQAIFLEEKLRLLQGWTEKKREFANRYLSGISNPRIGLPEISPDAYHSYHIFCVRVDDRQSFMEYMESHGITTIIHYPIPIHLTDIFDSSDEVYSSNLTDKFKDEIVSLPIHPYMDRYIDYIIEKINDWI